MPLRSDWSGEKCPIARGLDAFGDPWSVLVLREVFSGNRRFDTIRAELGAADNVLSSRLRGLVEGGLLERRSYSEGGRPRKEYWLTEAGRDTMPVLQALARWGKKHTVGPGPQPVRILCRSCGRDADAVDRCAHCDTPLTSENVEWRRSHEPGGPVVAKA
jgi:DNA-binding HxlR family transcriptional regulator